MPPKKKPVQKGEGLYDRIANRLFGAQLKDGEIHAPQYTSQGFRFGRFIGPGTDVFSNIRSGAIPVSKTDKASKLHDILYTLAQNPSDVRAADLRMVKKLESIQKEKGDYLFNLYMGKLPIKAKMLAEDWNLIKKGTFSSQKGALLSKEDREILEKEKAQLTQEGYGKPKSLWMTHVDNIRKKHPDKSYKQCLKLASASYKK